MLGVSSKVLFWFPGNVGILLLNRIYKTYTLPNRLSFQGNCLQGNDLKQRPSIQCGMCDITILCIHELKDALGCLFIDISWSLSHTEEMKWAQSWFHYEVVFTEIFFVFLILYIILNYYFIAGASPAKSQPVANPYHQPADFSPEHHGSSRPVWLLALEIVTGTMVGSLFLVAVLAVFQRCNKKSSIIIPWKKSASQKDHTTVYIGSVSLFSTFYLHLIALELFLT